MINLKIILLKSSSFLKIYLKEYLKFLIKPILIGFIGMLSLFLCIFGPIGAIMALLINIPCTCYALWRGYLITYSLNYAADSYAKTDTKVLISDCYNLAKKDGNKLAKFLCFSSLLCLLIYLPSLIYGFSNSDFISDLTFGWSFKKTLCFLLNGLILLPFYNFLNQAFFYEKEEKFIDLFLNCYKKLDKTGVQLVLIFGLLSLIGSFNSLVYILFSLILNPLIYCANTLWYKQKACGD